MISWISSLSTVTSLAPPYWWWMWSLIQPLLAPHLFDALIQVVDGEHPGLDRGHVIVLQEDHLEMPVWTKLFLLF